MLFALAMPVAKRVQNNMNVLTVRPDMNTKKPNVVLAHPTMGTRSDTVGEPPHRHRAEHEERGDALAMNTIVPELM